MACMETVEEGQTPVMLVMLMVEIPSIGILASRGSTLDSGGPKIGGG